jgi:hypothetical protein
LHQALLRYRAKFFPDRRVHALDEDRAAVIALKRLYLPEHGIGGPVKHVEVHSVAVWASCGSGQYDQVRDAGVRDERISEAFGQLRRADHAYVKSHGRSRQDAEMLCSYSAAMVPPCCRVSLAYPTEAELSSWSDWMSIDTASIRARWVNACGKLPRCWPVVTSISSA